MKYFKWLALIAAAVFAIGFVACSSDSDGSSSDDKTTKAYTVGDIVFSDGSATAYTIELTLTDEQKSKAVAVIFYAGSASDTLGAKTLGVGLKNATGSGSTLAWAKSGSNGYNNDTDITAIKCTPSESGSGGAATATFTGDTDGSDNWQALCKAVSDEETSGNYPAWEWVNAYATTANLTGGGTQTAGIFPRWQNFPCCIG